MVRILICIWRILSRVIDAELLQVAHLGNDCRKLIRVLFFVFYFVVLIIFLIRCRQDVSPEPDGPDSASEQQVVCPVLRTVASSRRVRRPIAGSDLTASAERSR